MTRIIAGSAKGTSLSAPKGASTRPTTDRTKEALFSALASWFGTADADAAHQLDGVAVLDLFAGSGALGLEAASRGARRVVLVDHHTAAFIRDNARRARLTVEVRSQRAEPAVGALSGPFDLVFADPPYDLSTADLDSLLARLRDEDVLGERALVVVERSRRTPAPSWPEEFTETWERHYGETTLHFGATDRQEHA